ncbi:MAG: hypothetical protein MJ070_08205 [Lachnospiraceae bacterium]|nr:hypothetical protein [Lachnospiraceae bacterium]
MSERFSALYANDRLKAYLAGAIDRASLSHAYLIEGAEGSGRHTVASIIAKALVCTGNGEKPCGKCLACRKVELGEHPDVRTFSLPKDRKTISVEIVRTIRDEAVLIPSESDRHVFLIENADAMTAAAQNALLKVLEEPPASVTFLLLTDRASGLIPTILSRVSVLHTEPLSAAQLDGFLTGKEPKAEAMKRTDPQGYAALLRLADGSAGRALTLLGSKKEGQEAKEIAAAEHVIELLAGGTHPELALFLNGAAQTRESLSRLCSFLSLALRDLVAVRTAKNAACLFYSDRRTAEAQADRLTIASLLKMMQITAKAENDLTANVNVTTARTVLAETLWEARSV